MADLTGKRCNVLMGPINIGNQMATLVKGLNDHGVFARTITAYSNRLAYKQHYPLKRMWPKSGKEKDILKFLEKYCIPHFDIFHFYGGFTFTRSHADLRLLSEAKKTMIMDHRGSEVRTIEKALKINPYAAVKGTFSSDQVYSKLEELSKYIRFCLVADEELRYYVKSYYEKVFQVPRMIDLLEYRINRHAFQRVSHAVRSSRNVGNIRRYSRVSVRAAPTRRPLIVHAPTHTGVKGTETIVKTMKGLQKDFKFDFQLIKGMAHEKAKRHYERADLIIDQLRIGSYGGLSAEAMALGKPVVCYISDFMLPYYPSDLPIINANPDTFPSVMRTLLANVHRWTEIGRASRKYVENHHDVRINSLKVKEIYKEILRS
ncbi:glycosyltransferase [Shouchella lonarensis]|uniref:Glycosyltransferase involved in cell wall bisynthesis n=1 Tax=Shouchella lonarensis TaxID=1464122 RepID=A0A1G6L8U5_9BACI|nr:glycosyltransferase [Shouchella lonarensis]SDC38956.1 Glycosyltransferase involved in cell wall bisynthesis [Shouchella lonarensis]